MKKSLLIFCIFFLSFAFSEEIHFYEKVHWNQSPPPIKMGKITFQSNELILEELLPLKSFTFQDRLFLQLDQVMLFGGKAYYSSYLNQKKEIRNCDIYPSPPYSYCKYIKNEDEIFAKKISCELGEKYFQFQRPKGSCNSIFFSKENPLHFTSNEMHWMKNSNLLVLQGDVYLSQKEVFQLFSDSVEVHYQENHPIPTIFYAMGHTELEFPEREERLVCDGTIYIDHNNRVVTAEADPLYFQEENFEVFSLKGSAYYQLKNNKLMPVLLIIDGGVQIVSNYEGITSYGIADKLTYDPEKQEIIMNASSGSPVYFWKEDESMTMKADEIVINPKGKAMGKGKVSFSFDQKEKERLNVLFSDFLKFRER